MFHENSMPPLFTRFGAHNRHTNSTCGSDVGPLVIQPPTCEAISFDWSDFPVISNDPSLELAMHDLYQHHSKRDVPPLLPSRNSALSFARNNENSTPRQARTRPRSTSNQKHVSFSDTIQVRTHNIVVGSHPFCAQQLPLELGWEYNEETDELSQKQDKATHSPPRRLFYLERKRLLLDVTQMTNEEIRETTLGHAKDSTKALSSLQSRQ